MSRTVFLALLFVLVPSLALTAQDKNPKLTVDQIYHSGEFSARGFGGQWLDDANSPASYTLTKSSDSVKGGSDIWRHWVDGREPQKMVDAANLIPAGESSPLSVQGHSWSANHNLLLIYTNSKRVWRNNTRGDYWVLDRSARQLRQLGKSMPPSSLMFAKFSPDGSKVAYVHERNIYVEDLFDQSITQITSTESDEIINGTTDWVYEEELGLRDAFFWSPDSESIAYWQIDSTGVQKFPLINQTDSLYPKVTWFAYPKVGQTNSSCRVGVIDLTSKETTWVDVPGDPRNHYIPRMSFVPGGETGQHRLLIQQLNRLQNKNQIYLADAKGNTTPVLTESDDAWVDVNNELFWLNDGEQFTWLSDRDGWRHVYIADTDSGEVKRITPGEFDVIQLVSVNESANLAYFIASPGIASQRYLYRVQLDGSNLQRVTPEGYVGVHSYSISPNGLYAFHTRSSANDPPITDLITMDDHAVVETLEDNQKLRERIATLDHTDTEFLRVDIGEGIELEGWCILPPNLDPKKKYPLLLYVYGEPAGTTVVDRWGGSSYLWHLMMAQHGYVVMSFDNRGTKSPRGRQWRKSIYKQIGVLPPKDQAAAVRAVLEQRPYLDKNRVGIWGWSGGGSSSLQAIFKYPDLYHTAIAVAPVPNQRYYDTIYQERYMSLPELNVEGFREGSAINFAHQLEGNLLLVHGTGDDNCHYATTEMLIDELIAHNKTFSMMAYPNRTHSIRERKNTTRHLRQMMTQYLLQNLPPN